MKRILRVVLSLSAVSIASLTSIVTVACSSNYITDPYVEMYQKYFVDKSTDNPYLEFLNTSEGVLNNDASTSENDKFNALYDDGTAPKTWTSVNSLETDLTTTPLSDTVTTNVDWDAMYNKVNLNPVEKNIALNEQLRFYNIIAKLYNKDNVLKLVQWVRPSSQQEGTVVAYNEYYPGVNSQTQTFGPSFASQAIIDDQYSQGYWSSDQLITVSTHEYGHAISNFLSASSVERDRFNTTYIEINSFSQSLKLPNKFLAATINDRTQNLINFLDQDAMQQGLITLNNDIEKFLFALLVVPSGYSQSAWEEDNQNQRDEFFAEAFAYWMLTPENQRSVRWSLLNDYFIGYVPNFYNI